MAPPTRIPVAVMLSTPLLLTWLALSGTPSPADTPAPQATEEAAPRFEAGSP